MMLQLIVGLVVLALGKLRVTRHHGLKGNGARIAGAIWTVYGLGYFFVLGNYILKLMKWIGLDNSQQLAVSVFWGLFIIMIVYFLVIYIYGNAYAKSNPSIADQSP